MAKSFICPCCGYLTLSEPSSGTFEICPVCNWEDDDVQFKNIDFEGGANEESLRQARINFKEFGASLKKYLKQVRAPLPDEIPNLIKIEDLIEILLDSTARIDERDDAAMNLAKYNDDRALEALIKAANLEEDNTVLNSVGESIGEIWVTRNIFNNHVYRTLPSSTRYGIYYVIRHDKPEWIQKYMLDKD